MNQEVKRPSGPAVGVSSRQSAPTFETLSRPGVQTDGLNHSFLGQAHQSVANQLVRGVEPFREPLFWALFWGAFLGAKKRSNKVRAMTEEIGEAIGWNDFIWEATTQM